MDTIHLLNHFVANNQILAYFFIFLVVIVEGEIIAIAAGIFILLGALNVWLCFIAIFCGGTVKTISGYSLGRLLEKRNNNNKFFLYIERKMLVIMPHFNQRPFWSIFISKFILVNHLVIIFSGYKKIKLKTYLTAEFISTILWGILMLSLGYFFSYTALNVSKEIGKFLLVVILFTIGYFLLDKFAALLYVVFENIENNNNGNKEV